jgi:hypothetical protein
LGRQLKQIHSEYRDVPDAKLGAALKAKFPEFYGHATDEPDIIGGKQGENRERIGGSRSDLDSATVPETGGTIRLQMQQLAEGLRRVVFIARGSKTKVNPADYGIRKLTLPSGTYLYDPHTIKPQEIMQAVMNDGLADILGSATKGYGAPSKQDLQGQPQAVVARDGTGETSNSALTDQEHMPEAVEAAEELTPAGGSISVEDPSVEIEHRLKKKPRGDRWPKAPQTPVKLPPGVTA